jgi:ribosomal protein S18 acetylase RimI-like enzyme
VSYEIGDGVLAATYHDDICALYSEVFSSKPFAWHPGDAEVQSKTLQQIGQRRDFAVVLAISDRLLIGFAYGHGLPVGHGWWQDFAYGLPSAVTDEWDGRTFALIDFAVAKSWRGRGIGRTILSKLLGSRTEERAVLSVQPSARQTRQTYRNWGWIEYGIKGPIQGVDPPYWSIMGIELRGRQNYSENG